MIVRVTQFVRTRQMNWLNAVIVRSQHQSSATTTAEEQRRQMADYQYYMEMFPCRAVALVSDNRAHAELALKCLNEARLQEGMEKLTRQGCLQYVTDRLQEKQLAEQVSFSVFACSISLLQRIVAS